MSGPWSPVERVEDGVTLLSMLQGALPVPAERKGDTEGILW